MNTRRQFLIKAPLGLLGATGRLPRRAEAAGHSMPSRARRAADVRHRGRLGPDVTPATFAEAEKLVQVTMTPAQRQQAADSWRQSMAAYLERRTGPAQSSRSTPTDAPATLWNPMLAGRAGGPTPRDRFVRSAADAAPLPSSDDDIAFAPVTRLSRWIESRKLTSERLTNIYLDRIERLDPKLNAIITLTEGARARAGAPGRRRDRGREVPRPAARHSRTA